MIKTVFVFKTLEDFDYSCRLNPPLVVYSEGKHSHSCEQCYNAAPLGFFPPTGASCECVTVVGGGGATALVATSLPQQLKHMFNRERLTHTKGVAQLKSLTWFTPKSDMTCHENMFICPMRKVTVITLQMNDKIQAGFIWPYGVGLQYIRTDPFLISTQMYVCLCVCEGWITWSDFAHSQTLSFLKLLL